MQAVEVIAAREDANSPELFERKLLLTHADRHVKLRRLEQQTFSVELKLKDDFSTAEEDQITVLTYHIFRDSDLVEISQLAVSLVHRCNAVDALLATLLHQLHGMFVSDVNSLGELSLGFFRLTGSQIFFRLILGGVAISSSLRLGLCFCRKISKNYEIENESKHLT